MTADNVLKRRLAAILVADVVGYSRLMEADEAGTLGALRQRRASVLDPVVRANHGRIVKVMGDGVLIEFASAVDAVKAALALQVGMTDANTDVAPDRQIIMRIGINLGDVIGEGRDIYGESVNIAARLETLAEPGGICVSAKVHDEVDRKVDCSFQDMGPQSVKNIARDVRAYHVRPVGAEQAAHPKPDLTRPDLALPDRPSIAVLPFQNMSADAEQEYFADGMVEDIITELSRAKWLFVIARNSSFAYKGKAVDIKQVGRELGVRYVLEGSVRRAGQRLRITGQLIDASTGAHLWADRFDGDVADVFDLQDQITQSVVGTIAPRMELAEIDRTKHKPTESMDAYDHHLRGMAEFNTFDRAANARALTHFLRAFELDPEYAAACGMAARTYAQRVGFGWLGDPEIESSEAIRLARLAAKLGPDDAIALAAAGFAMSCFHNVPDGDALLERAVALNPNLAWAWHMSGISKVWCGYPEEAILRAARALRLSPQDTQAFGIQSVLAFGNLMAGHFDTAISHAETCLRLRPHFLFGQAVLAASAASAGRHELAARATARMAELQPDLRVATLKNWLSFVHPEDNEKWEQALRRAGLPD